MYAVHCLLPYDRYIAIENHVLIESKETENDLIAITICFHNSDGIVSSVNCVELSELLSFNYIDRLFVIHERILREMLFSLHIPELIDNTYDQWFCDRRISPNISVRHIGIIKGIDVGYGIYADATLPPNEWVGEYVGVVQSISNCEYKDVTTDAYAFLYPSCDSAYEINALEYGNVIRFVNHSNSPNSEFRRLYYGGLWHIVVFTLRRIDANEQVTVSYGETYWKHKGISPADF